MTAASINVPVRRHILAVVVVIVVAAVVVVVVVVSAAAVVVAADANNLSKNNFYLFAWSQIWSSLFCFGDQNQL